MSRRGLLKAGALAAAVAPAAAWRRSSPNHLAASRPAWLRRPAWARPRYVSHRVFDHASICKLAETKWNLPAMTYRDANAADMLDMIDLRRPAFRTPPRLAAPLLDTDPGVLACDASGPGVIPPPGSATGPAAAPAG